MHRLHAFLAGRGPDHRGRSFREVVAYDDMRLEMLHDYIQWLFPLAEPSRAVPGAPVLAAGEAEAIRADPVARANLKIAADRMARFYRDSDHWIAPFDHNHLRITRIIASLRMLVGRDAAAGFLAIIEARAAMAGDPINPESRRYWRAALG